MENISFFLLILNNKLFLVLQLWQHYTANNDQAVSPAKLPKLEKENQQQQQQQQQEQTLNGYLQPYAYVASTPVTSSNTPTDYSALAGLNASLQHPNNATAAIVVDPQTSVATYTPPSGKLLSHVT